jgi:two-component system phosphate regulon response regulator PhoB
VSTERDILVVEDDPAVGQLLLAALREAGFRPKLVTNGQTALKETLRLRPAVVVLDVMLPDLSGTEVCRRLRADHATQDVGILMVSGRTEEFDRCLGFELGADDYVVKPFSVRELTLRVRALVRRMRKAAPARVLRWGGVEVDISRHKVSVDGAQVDLRPLEYKLLTLFMTRPGAVFSRQKLLTDVWGLSPEVNTRTVDTHVRRLRDRLGIYGEAVETVHGFGYRLRESELLPVPS